MCIGVEILSENRQRRRSCVTKVRVTVLVRVTVSRWFQKTYLLKLSKECRKGTTLYAMFKYPYMFPTTLLVKLSCMYYILFHDLLLWSYLYHCVRSEITGRISLQTTVIDKRTVTYKLPRPLPAPFQAAATMLLPGEVTATAWLPTWHVVSVRQCSYPVSALSGVHLPGKSTVWRRWRYS